MENDPCPRNLSYFTINSDLTDLLSAFQITLFSLDSVSDRQPSVYHRLLARHFFKDFIMHKDILAG